MKTKYSKLEVSSQYGGGSISISVTASQKGAVPIFNQRRFLSILANPPPPAAMGFGWRGTGAVGFGWTGIPAALPY